MPLPTNNSRPSLPYTPDQSLPNNQRFNLLGKRPPTAQMLDAEFNSLQDDINRLAHGINEVEVGNIPGADDPLNANKVLKTDGHGTLSFTLINSNQLAPNAVVEAALAPQSVTTTKIGDGAVTSSKIASESIQTRHLQANAVNTDELANQAVTSEKLAPVSVQTAAIEDQAVTTDKIADGAITTAEIADRAVTTAKLANAAVSTLQLGLGAVTTNELGNLAVTNPKVAVKAIRDTNIDSQAAASGTVLVSQGAGNTSFRKISSGSLDGSLITRGAVLGSTDGVTLSPQFLPVFSIFENLSSPFGQWRGYNIRTVVIGGSGAPTPYSLRITFNGGYNPDHYDRYWLWNPGVYYSFHFRGDPSYPSHLPRNCDLIIPLNGPSNNKFILYYYPETS